MSAELLRKWVEAANRAAKTGELDEWISFYSEEVEWEAVEDAPDAGTYRGHDGLRGYLLDWLGTVDDFHIEVSEMAELEGGFVADVRAIAVVKGSDARIDIPYSVVVRFAEGKIVHGKEFRERADAVAYLGG